MYNLPRHRAPPFRQARHSPRSQGRFRVPFHVVGGRGSLGLVPPGRRRIGGPLRLGHDGPLQLGRAVTEPGGQQGRQRPAAARVDGLTTWRPQPRPSSSC
jgi:hypothetical protein